MSCLAEWNVDRNTILHRAFETEFLLDSLISKSKKLIIQKHLSAFMETFLNCVYKNLFSSDSGIMHSPYIPSSSNTPTHIPASGAYS